MVQEVEGLGIGNNNYTMQPQTLDKDVVNLAKAIRQVESGNREVLPKEGSKLGGASRYQFTHDTWKSSAKKFLGDENAPLTLQNENQVAYKQIKEWKDAGKNVGQVASLWNSGDDQAYLGTFGPNHRLAGKPSVGRNEWGVDYDVPGHAQKVASAYQVIKAQEQLLSGRNQPVTPQQPQEKTLGQDLKDISTNRLTQAGDAIDKALDGQQDPVSAGLQVVGAGAGGLLDVIGAGVKATPVLGDVAQFGEDMLGKVANAAAETDLGKSALGKYQEFSQAHPTAAANIGAGINIASAIPIVKGLAMPFKAPGFIKDSLMKGGIEKDAIAELEQAASTRITGSNLLKDNAKRGINPVQTLIKERLLPDVEPDLQGTNRYNTVRAEEQLAKQIDDLDDQLDSILRETSGKISGYIPTQDLKRMVMEEIEDQFKGSPELNRALRATEDDIDSILRGYGDKTLLTLEDLNHIKREVRKSVNFKSRDLQKLERNVNYHEGQVFMRIIEDVTDREFKKLGLDSALGSVQDLNKQMAERIVAQELLRRHINGKRVSEMPKWGKLGMMGEAALVSGLEAGGQAIGAPVVGGLAGKLVVNAARKPKQTALSKLKNKGKKRGILKSTQLPTALSVQGTYRGYQEEKQNQ